MSKDERFFLKHVLQSIELIEEYVGSMAKEEFFASQEKRDVVERRLEIIGEAVANLPKEFRKKYPHVPWSEIVATRNNLIHEYFSAQPSTIWRIIEHDLPELKENAQKIFQEVKGQYGE